MMRLPLSSAVSSVTDPLSPEQRSARMRRIPRANTAPEMIVRRLAHHLGYRYRLHQRALPGTPDLTFPRRKKIIFVHGCFWHRHRECSLASTPKNNRQFWVEKFEANVQRDRRKEEALRELGWDVLTIWQCETRMPFELEQLLRNFLGPPTSRARQVDAPT